MLNKNKERNTYCSETTIRTISSIDKDCNHKWKFIKGGFWKDDKFVCENCGSWKLSCKH